MIEDETFRRGRTKLDSTKWIYCVSASLNLIFISNTIEISDQYKNNLIQNQYGLQGPSTFPDLFDLSKLTWTSYKRYGKCPTVNQEFIFPSNNKNYNNSDTAANKWFQLDSDGFFQIKSDYFKYLIKETSHDPNVEYGWPINSTLIIPDDESGTGDSESE